MANKLPFYSVLPEAQIDLRDFNPQMYLSPSYTYRFDMDNDRISGYIDNDVALEQAIILALYTEQGKYEIYPEDYGIELNDLFGLNMDLVKVRLPKRIEECLMQDLRIDSVEVTDMQEHGNQLRCTVICNGNIKVDYEVEV